MAEQEKRKAGGGKLSRSETVTVRLDPKLSYLCELAARTQRRTRSSFIEWAVEHALADVTLVHRDANGDAMTTNLAALAEAVWNIDEWERVVRLATFAPELLSIEEQKWWGIAREEGWLWVDPKGPRAIENADRKVFRRSWSDIKAVAEGRMTDVELNQLAMTRA